MRIIGNLAEIAVFVLFFRLIYLIFKCKKTKNWSLFKKDGIIFVICFILTGIFADTPSNKKNSTRSQVTKIEKSTDKSSSEKSSQILNETSSEGDDLVSSSCVSSENINNNQTNDNVQTNTDNGMDHTAQQGKVIGNIKTHIYHTADEHDYKISPNNEIVFSNEQDAINAGYRKALR